MMNQPAANDTRHDTIPAPRPTFDEVTVNIRVYGRDHDLVIHRLGPASYRWRCTTTSGTARCIDDCIATARDGLQCGEWSAHEPTEEEERIALEASLDASVALFGG